MNIATVAMDTVWKDPKANIGQVEQHVAGIMQRWPKAQIILFPEMCLHGYVIDESNQQIAEPLDGYCVTEVKRIAREHNVAIICAMAEKNPDGGKPFNSTFVVSKDGELLAVYHKNHLFTESTEPDAIAPGTELATFEFDGWKCGLSTCFDIRFPRLFETYKKAGVECVFSPFNWVQGRNKPEIMETLVKARAHENQFFFVVVDRTGSDPNTSYYGTSIISNPYCEDNAERNGVYAYAELNKDDIAALAKALPLAGSFRAEYTLKSE